MFHETECFMSFVDFSRKNHELYLEIKQAYMSSNGTLNNELEIDYLRQWWEAVQRKA